MRVRQGSAAVAVLSVFWAAAACSTVEPDGDGSTGVAVPSGPGGPVQTDSSTLGTTGGLPPREGGTAQQADSGAGALDSGRLPDSGRLGEAGAVDSGDGVIERDGGGEIDAGTVAVDAGTGDAGKDDLCGVGLDDGSPAPTALTLSGNTFAHDPTMIEADGVFYRFWTGERIPSATSTDLMFWRDAPPVYRDGYPEWSRDWLASVPGQTFNFPWAPDVSFFGGRYHLDSSFSARFGRNISCITHLTTTDIAAGDWTDHGPVICTDGSERYNAIDADVGFDEDGNPWLAFGSFWDGIMMFPLDENGDRVGSELTQVAAKPDGEVIEAPVLFRRCGYYYLFVSWGLCCPGEGRRVDQLTYRVAVGRSRDITGPYLDRNGVSLVDGGGTLVVEGDRTFAAAGHSDILVSGDAIYHHYHAYRYPTGRAELRIIEMRFSDDGWPLPASP